MGRVRKPKERIKARRLRRGGESLKIIARMCGVSPSTVKAWTDDIELTKEQRLVLYERQQEHRRANGRKTAQFLHARKGLSFKETVALDRQEAEHEWASLRLCSDFMFGLALYVGEGDKTGSRLGLTNADPRVLRKSLEFFRLIGADMPRVRVQVVLHQGEDPVAAQMYWSQELGLALEQINKITPSKHSGGQRARKLIHGTASIRVGCAPIKRKLNRWMELSLSG